MRNVRFQQRRPQFISSSSVTGRKWLFSLGKRLNCDFPLMYVEQVACQFWSSLTVFLAFHRVPMRGSLQALRKWRDMLRFTFSMQVSGTYRFARMRHISQSFPVIRFFINSSLETHWNQKWLLFICWIFRGWGEILISCLTLEKKSVLQSSNTVGFSSADVKGADMNRVVYTDGYLWVLICSASTLISCTC